MKTNEKEIEESLNNLPEARSSVTFKVVSPKGFPILLTLRSGDVSELFEIINDTDLYLIEKGFQADIKTNGAKPKEYTGELCPLDGGKLVKFTTKTGKTGSTCENRKYNAVTQSTVGCTYVKWDEPSTSSNGTSSSFNPSSDLATPNQRRVLEENGQWREGLTKKEASLLIANIIK